MTEQSSDGVQRTVPWEVVALAAEKRSDGTQDKGTSGSTNAPS